MMEVGRLVMNLRDILLIDDQIDCEGFLLEKKGEFDCHDT